MDARNKKKADHEFRKISSQNSRQNCSGLPEAITYSQRRTDGRHPVPKHRKKNHENCK